MSKLASLKRVLIREGEGRHMSALVASQLAMFTLLSGAPLQHKSGPVHSVGRGGGLEARTPVCKKNTMATSSGPGVVKNYKGVLLCCLRHIPEDHDSECSRRLSNPHWGEKQHVVCVSFCNNFSAARQFRMDRTHISAKIYTYM